MLAGTISTVPIVSMIVATADLVVSSAEVTVSATEALADTVAGAV